MTALDYMNIIVTSITQIEGTATSQAPLSVPLPDTLPTPTPCEYATPDKRG